MELPTKSFAILVMLFVSFVVSLAAQQKPVAQSAGLRIVVIGGEGAVNIIQQRTAVAPLIEVRDANNLPVPGVAVTFSVGGQGATFGGGLQTLTVTTNAAGQAAATGLTPTVTGAIQINATAALQGQTITATITQTNFATAQAAAQAATTAGSGSSAGTTAGAGAGSGGGMSTGAVVGIVGGVGAAAAGAGSRRPSTETKGSGGTSYTGTLAGQLTIVQTVTGPGQHSLSCTYNRAYSAARSRSPWNNRAGRRQGEGRPLVTSTDLAASAPNCGSGPGGGNLTNPFNCPVTGTTGSLECVQRRTEHLGDQHQHVHARVLWLAQWRCRHGDRDLRIGGSEQRRQPRREFHDRLQRFDDVPRDAALNHEAKAFEG